MTIWNERDKRIFRSFEAKLAETIQHKISRLKTVSTENLQHSQGVIRGLEEALTILTNIEG